MAITVNTPNPVPVVGFTEARLEAANGAALYALYDYQDFYVSPEEELMGKGKGWFFTKAGCIEAAEFFTKLADELARRGF